MMSFPHFPDQNRPDRAVIAITGDGALAWLNNLLTCDVSTLGVGSAAYGALLSPQGKILHDMFVFHAEGRVLIDCAAEHSAALLQKLAMYRLRAKLMIVLDNELEVSVHLEKPDGAMCYRDPRLEAMGWRSFVGSGTLINVPGHRGYDERRIMLGLADSVQDIGVEKVFPHEANFDQLGAVNFSKGCYVGQEVVSRMQHRGTARNRMLPVRFSTKPEDMKITADGKTVGEIHSCSETLGLALIRIDRLAEARLPLKAGATDVHVALPDWLKYEVPT
jgi:tRNA-modifying protein YgfZ